MKTIQGKEFNFYDVILYNHNNNEIIMIVNDTENLDKYKYTNNPKDAPIIIVPYKNEYEKQVIKHMKKIQKYEKVSDGIEVLYTDNTKVLFDLSNEEVIKSNFEAQKKLISEEILAISSNLSIEEKNRRRADITEKLKKGFVSILANLSIIDSNIKNNKDKKQSNKELISNEYVNNSKDLYQEIINKNSFLLKYQEIIDINWNEKLALEIVELLNNKYPNSIKNMNFENSKNEIRKILQSLVLLITGNLNPETTKENMVDLSKFFDIEKNKVLVHNAMIITKNAVNELIGEPTNYQILDETKYSSVNKLPIEYKGAVDQLLNYEFKTLNDKEFLELDNSCKWLIILIFEQANNIISEESSIDVEVSGKIQKMYYRYFSDFVENKTYIPKIDKNGNIMYCEISTNTLYSKDEMFALAGLSLLEENNIEPNPNINELGISIGVEEKFNIISEEIFNINN